LLYYLKHWYENFTGCRLSFKIIILFICLLTLGYAPVKNAAVTTMPEVAAARPLRLFIIGNSFSRNATTYLPQIVKEKGKELIIGRSELGGCSLERHWKLAEAAESNPNDSAGKAYKGKSLRMLYQKASGMW